MRSNRLYIRLTLSLTILVLTLLTAGPPALAQQETVLYNFSLNDVLGPQAGVIFDAAGNLYGTSNRSVYQLIPPQSGGSWTENTLYTVGSLMDTEGNLVFDGAGNLYGVAISDTVFELTPSATGTWTEKTLFTFSPTATKGWAPYGGVIFDLAGNLYGTTAYGGIYGSQSSGGTVFELMPQAGGTWSEKVLHSFGNGNDGHLPVSNLIFDSAGNLYGTTQAGGANSAGTVFELMPQAGGGWKEKILHSFGGGFDGQSPRGGVILDASGNLYGTTTGGGLYNGGTAFKLIPQVGGAWKEKLLHSFGNGSDGQSPEASLIFDNNGNLYGTTFFGGTSGGGVAFELRPNPNGLWAEKILHNFGQGTDGSGSLGNLIFDAAGNLYGTTQGGGTSGEGTVFQITPLPHGD